ncbi:MAG TPA: hypothetical protein VEX66_12455, partial [Microlunatus sp.]|nr:hypothetical protein [Microlunatus sp.]
MSDPEINAMSAVATALADLEEDQRGRVLRWAAERYSVALPDGGVGRGSSGGPTEDGGGDS